MAHRWALWLLLFPLGAVLLTWAMVATARDFKEWNYWDA